MAGQELPRQRTVTLEEALEVTRIDDLAAVFAGEGSDVDDVVRLEDRGLVVLDHDQRVAEVPEPHEGVDESPVVALVQADRRLVEDVQHPDEAAADLGREPDALRFAPGEGAGGSRE